mgnify:CR=1 FL=1|tara:strand:+ start:1022 stop:1243 length:222 start_codon:yes stop_codon:yes gene_type:complete
MKHVQLISKSFKQRIKKDDSNKNLNDFIWDSLIKITLITEFNKKYKKNLDYKKIEKIKTFKQLDKLIESAIKK